MTSLYLDRKDTIVNHERKRLWIRTPERKHSLPVSQVDRIIISSNCSIESNTLLMLDEHEVPVILVDFRRGRATWCGGWHRGDTGRRLAQYAISQDTDFCTRAARLLIAHKLMHHHRLLGFLMRQCPQQRRQLFQSRAQVGNLIGRLSMAELEELRGLEGAAGRSFFAGYTSVFPERLNFTGRNRRPPKDPVNACLSLAYTLLGAEALQALYQAGLDPSLGFLHQPVFNRDSLSCDLVENLRPAVDRWVWHMFKNKVLDTPHFYEREGGCFLDKEGRALFYTRWEGITSEFRQRLRWQANQWAKSVDAYRE